MKSKTVLLCGLLSVVQVSFAVSVDMPSREVLERRLKGVGFTHFAEKSGIVDALANQTLEFSNVIQKIETSISKYNEKIKSLPVKLSRLNQYQLRINKDLLLRALLADSPEALTILKEQGSVNRSRIQVDHLRVNSERRVALATIIEALA